MKKAIARIAKEAISNKVFPGCVVGVVRRNGDRFFMPFGNFTYDKDSRKIEKDSVFDVASITKSIPTASLALKLIEDKKLNVEDKITKYIPELDNSFRDKVEIKHLLTHTLYYHASSRLSSHKNKKPGDFLDTIFRFEYRLDPGKCFAYANANSILLGLIIERISQKTLDELAHETFSSHLV